MNRRLTAMTMAFLFCCAQPYAQNSTKKAIKKIIIEGEIPPVSEQQTHNNSPNKRGNIEEMAWLPFDFVSSDERKITKAQKSNGIIKWVLPSEKPLVLQSPYLDYTKIIAPGDSIRIRYDGTTVSYSGKGSAAFRLQTKMLAVKNQKKPTSHYFSINNLEEYFSWMDYLDNQLKDMISLIDAYKDSVSQQSYDYLKFTHVRLVEEARSLAFNNCYDFIMSDEEEASTKSSLGLSLTDLNAIWDSTQKNTQWGKWLRSQAKFYNGSEYLYDFNRQTVRRKFNFDFSHDSLRSLKLRHFAYYNEAKKYRGVMRERLLTRILAEEVILEMGPWDELTQVILNDYYNLPGYPEFKNHIKKFHKKTAALTGGKWGPDFTLYDKRGKPFSKNNLKGKVVLLDFWFTGCTGCVQMTPALRQIEESFKNDSNVIFVSVSTDKDKNTWLKSINEKKYTTGDAFNLYTGGQGNNHPIINTYGISGYPELHLLDGEGRIVQFPLPDPRNPKDRKTLISLIEKESAKAQVRKIALAQDGPYVLYNDNNISVNYIETGNNATIVRTENSQAKNQIVLKVSTDKPGKYFPVTLKESLEDEPSIFENVTKQFVISDIEGNFRSLRQLLQSNKIIDENFNWTFGDGHLVLNGDFFDRGLQVTECLWLIYSLEEKAKKARGYVHFILGNHEIMNLQNDIRYVADKYKDNAKLIGVKYADLFNTKSELGNWLRKKNIIEKIGNVVYVHGGIAPAVNRLKWNIEEINKNVRPYYTGKIDSSKTELLVLLNDSWIEGIGETTAPFWFRGYYNKNEAPTLSQVDSTLKKFAVDMIVTGHTITDSVNMHYEGKVVNVDTRHAEGKSEGLYIENNQLFRVNMEGERKKLIKTNKTAASTN